MNKNVAMSSFYSSVSKLWKKTAFYVFIKKTCFFMLFLKSKKMVLCSLIIKFSYIFFQRVRTIGFITYEKFRRFVMFHTLVLSGLNFGGRVPLWLQWVQCHHAIVTLCVRNFFWLVIRGSKTFSHGCFVGPKFFLM